MSSALRLRNTEGYLYALGRMHGGSEIDPEWFAAAYESAKESWQNSEPCKRKWIGVAAYYEEFKRRHVIDAA